MEGIDFKRTNNKQKAYIKLAQTLAGHSYMQFHAACGLLTSYIHFNEQGAYTEDGLKIPAYCKPLIESANMYLSQSYGSEAA